MHAFAATFWTFDVAFFVFRKSKDYFKWLLAIFAVELIARHGDLRKNARPAGLLIYGVRSRIAGVKQNMNSAIMAASGRPSFPKSSEDFAVADMELPTAATSPTKPSPKRRMKICQCLARRKKLATTLMFALNSI
jgi:hypothetical protein